MTAQQLTAEAAPIVGQLKGSKNALGRYLYATLEHANKHSDGNVVANLYRLLKTDDINSGHLRAVRHATLDCTGFVLNCTNDKTNGIKVTSKRDQEAWARTKGDISAANLARLIGPEMDGAGISTFVNRPKVKKANKSANDDDGTGNGEVKNSYESAIGGLATIMGEINEIAPNDKELLADLQVLLAMEAKLKSKLVGLKQRLSGSLLGATG
jgi:hypothetical protein